MRAYMIVGFVAASMLANLAGAQNPSCSTRVLSESSTVMDEDGSVMSQAQVEVRREFKKVVLSVDPQNWARCSPDFFKVSRMTEGRFTPGTNYSGIFYEEVSKGDSWAGADFKNNLLIQTSITQDHWRMNYSLAQSLESHLTVLGLVHEQEGGLVKDEGYIEVAPVDGDTFRVTVVKNVKFSMSDPLLPLWTPGIQNQFTAGVLLMGQALADQVCCPL